MAKFKIYVANYYTEEHKKACKLLAEKLCGDVHTVDCEEGQFLYVEADEDVEKAFEAFTAADFVFCEKISDDEFNEAISME